MENSKLAVQISHDMHLLHLYQQNFKTINHNSQFKESVLKKQEC
jgi:hypothetical protein